MLSHGPIPGRLAGINPRLRGEGFMLLMLMQLAGAASVNSTASEQTPPRNKFKRLSMARARLILKVAFALICPIEQTPPWPPRHQSARASLHPVGLRLERRERLRCGFPASEAGWSTSLIRRPADATVFTNSARRRGRLPNCERAEPTGKPPP